MMVERIERGLEVGKAPLYASFGLLVDASGHPILAQRRTSPHEGLFSLVGGKIDQNPYTQPYAGVSEDSRRLVRQGYESPTKTIAREVAEELYRSVMEEDPKKLREIFRPKRIGLVYDEVQNAYCFLYTVKQPKGLKFDVASREVGAIKVLKDIPSDQINPLTQFCLQRQSYQAALPSAIQWGRIPRMALPSDCLAAVAKKKLVLSKEPEGPAWLIKY